MKKRVLAIYYALAIHGAVTIVNYNTVAAQAILPPLEQVIDAKEVSVPSNKEYAHNEAYNNFLTNIAEAN